MWARNEGFTKDQLTEFDHLMSMVSSTHIIKNKLSNVGCPPFLAAIPVSVCVHDSIQARRACLSLFPREKSKG